MKRPLADIFFGTGNTCLLLALWLVLGPGPKYEEYFGAIGVAVLVGVVGLIVSVVRPRPLLGPVLYSGLWFLAFLVHWGQIALAYDYAYASAGALGFGFKIAATLWAGLLLINSVALAVHHLVRMMLRDNEGQPHDPRETAP